jgi:hypothetical protein
MMGFFTTLIDSLLERSWNRVRDRNLALGQGAIVSKDAPRRSVNASRTLTIHRATNGEYIEYTRHRFNPTGPDEYVNEVYLIRDDEALVDAISTVLVLLDKP